MDLRYFQRPLAFFARIAIGGSPAYGVVVVFAIASRNRRSSLFGGGCGRSLVSIERRHVYNLAVC